MSPRLLSLLAIIVSTAAACAVESGNSRTDSASQQDGTITAMTYNIFHDINWDARKELIVRAIRNEQPDIVGLQEALYWQLEFLTDRLSGYAFVAAGRDDGLRGGESVGIMYDSKRFELLDSGSFWFSNQPEVPGSMPGDDWGSPNLPRICTWLRLLETAGGRSVYVFNVHLQHDAGTDPELARTRSVELLVDQINRRQFRDPVIAMGDFNATADEAPMQFLILTNSMAFVDTHGEDAAATASGTRCFDSDDTGRRIDHILASPNVAVRAIRTGGKIDGHCPSDHRPVIAVLEPWHGR